VAAKQSGQSSLKKYKRGYRNERGYKYEYLTISFDAEVGVDYVLVEGGDKKRRLQRPEGG